MRRDAQQKIQAFRLFFPAISLYAALAVPLSVYAMTSGNTWLPGLSGSGHAHEMLFGFALALVAGYTLGPMPGNQLLILFALWLAARPASIIIPDSPITSLLNTAFALMLAGHIVPRFMTAKKWRNRIISPLLLGLCALPVAYAIGIHYSIIAVRYDLFPPSVLLFALLMVFMGGRIIAPAAAGESERQGFTLESRVQPRLEATLIILLAAAVLALFFPQGHLPAGLAIVITGIISAIRLYRWRLWRCRRRPDLIGLGIGYGWLALGLFLYGVGIFLNTYSTAALHIITVGALGTLSTGVMLRINSQHSTRQAPHTWIVLTIAGLIAMAALSRGAANLVIGKLALLLWTAAIAWFCAYLLLAFYLLFDRKKFNQRS